MSPVQTSLLSAARYVVQKHDRLLEAREHAGARHELQGDVALAEAEMRSAETMLDGAMDELRRTVEDETP